jgi:riboflavin kinase/FMN adenylyltransferase
MFHWRSLTEVPTGWGPSAVTIGKFDGVHLGHVEILRQLAEISATRGLKSTVITFDRHPASLLSPDQLPADILSTQDRLALIEQQNIDASLVLVFDTELAGLSPRDFVTTILLGKLNTQVVLVGHDFRFGENAAGDVATLQQLGAELGFDVVLIDDVSLVDGVRVSSSLIRELMASGDVAAAAQLLGRLPRVNGEVVHGEKRGRELGFPTANLSQDATGLVPSDGVYAGWFLDGDNRYPAAISVGTNPTFEGVNKRTVEAFLLDQNLDLYGHQVTIEFAAHIRGMVAYNGIEPLIEQMHDDVRLTREILGLGK